MSQLPAYVIAEITPTDPERYLKEAAPAIGKIITDAGGEFIVRGGKSVRVEGDPPAPRVVIYRFESLEQARAWAESESFKTAWDLGKKYANFRMFAVEGLAPR